MENNLGWLSVKKVWDEAKDWWFAQVKSRSAVEVILDQVAAIFVQVIFWALLAFIVVEVTPGSLSSSTPLIAGVSDFLTDIYNADHMRRDLLLVAGFWVIFLLMSIRPVVLRIQEDGCRILYLFGTLTCVMWGFFRHAGVQFGIGHTALWIGGALCSIGMAVSVMTEYLLRWREKKNVRGRIFAFIRRHWILSLITFVVIALILLRWRL